MRRAIVPLSLFFLMIAAVSAGAATYQQRLPDLEGYYSVYENQNRYASFNFGVAFASVDFVSLRLVGEASDSQDWLAVPNPEDPYGPPSYTIMYFPLMFSAGIPDANPSFGMHASGIFDLGIEVRGSTDCLLQNGSGMLNFYCEIPQFNGPRGFATIDEAYLLVDGVTAPEPSSWLVLGSGILGLLAARRKRG